jgi:hypothetical protein
MISTWWTLANGSVIVAVLHLLASSLFIQYIYLTV